MGDTLLQPARPRARSRNSRPRRRSNDDLNLDAVSARLKPIGGKQQDEEE